VFTRGTPNDAFAVVLASKSMNAETIVLAPGTVPSGDYLDAMDDAEFRVDDAAPTSIPMSPLSVRILTPRSR